MHFCLPRKHCDTERRSKDHNIHADMQSTGHERHHKKQRQETATLPERALAYAAANRGRTLTSGEKLDILAIQAALRADNTSIPRRESVTATVSRLLRRSTAFF